MVGMDSLKNHRGKILFFLSIVLIAGGYFFFWTYSPSFRREEILSVELLKVQAPNLGGVFQRKLLAPENIDAFYKDLQWARNLNLGPVKMFTCYKINVTTTSGKIFSFRTNGNKFFGQHTDTLYDFGGDENRITKYWNIQPDCSDLSEK